MSDKTSLHSYEFIKDRLSKDELVSIIRGDIPGYLKDKIDDLTIVVNNDLKLSVNTNYIIELVKDNTPVNARFIFKRAAVKPAPPNDPVTELAIPDPTGVNYGDWKLYPEADGVDGNGLPLLHHLWMSTAIFVFDIPMTGWSDPIRIDGDSGYEYVTLYTKASTKPTAPTSNDPTKDIPKVWYTAISDIPGISDEDTIWIATAIRKEGILVGVWSVALLRRTPDSLRIVYIHKRSETKPDTPVGPNIAENIPHPVPDESEWVYGDWSYNWYAPNVETHLLWTSCGYFNQRDELVGEWCEPFNWHSPPQGYYKKFVYKAAPEGSSVPSKPSPPYTVSPAGWYNSPQEALDQLGVGMERSPIYSSSALIKVVSGVHFVIEDWSTPVRWNGIRGEDAMSLFLTKSSHVFVMRTDKDGNVTSDPDKIEIEAHLRNITGGVTFEVLEGEATLSLVSGQPYKRELLFEDMISNLVKIKAYVTGSPEFYDIITIVKIGEGIGWTWLAVNGLHHFHADYEGNVTNNWNLGTSYIVGYKNITGIQCQSTTVKAWTNEELDIYSFVVTDISLSTPGSMTYDLSIDGRNLKIVPSSLTEDLVVMTISVKAKAEEDIIYEGKLTIQYGKQRDPFPGTYTEFIWKRSKNKPATPVDPFPVPDEGDWEYGDWSYSPYPMGVNEEMENLNDHLWFSTAEFKTVLGEDDEMVRTWSEPIQADSDTLEKLLIFTATFKVTSADPIVPTPVAVTNQRIPADWSTTNPNYTGKWFSNPLDAFAWAEEHYGDEEDYSERYVQIWVSLGIMNDRGYFIEEWSDPSWWNGLDGEGAYSVFLTNENHTYHASYNDLSDLEYLKGGYSEVRVYKGDIQFECTNVTLNDTNPVENRTYKISNIEYLVGSHTDMEFDFELKLSPDGKNQYVLKPIIKEDYSSNSVVLRLTIAAQDRFVDTTFVRYVSYSIVKNGTDAWEIEILPNQLNTVWYEDGSPVTNLASLTTTIKVSKGVTRLSCEDLYVDESDVPSGNLEFTVYPILGDPTAENWAVTLDYELEVDSVDPTINNFKLVPQNTYPNTAYELIHKLPLLIKARYGGAVYEIIRYVTYTKKNTLTPEDGLTAKLTNENYDFIMDNAGIFSEGAGLDESLSEFEIYIGTTKLTFDGTVTNGQIVLGEATVNDTYRIQTLHYTGITPGTLGPTTFNYVFDKTAEDQLTLKSTAMAVPFVTIRFIISIRHRNENRTVTLYQKYKITGFKAALSIRTSINQHTFIRNSDGTLSGSFSAGDVTLTVARGDIRYNCINQGPPAPPGTNEFGAEGSHNGADFTFDVYPTIAWGEALKPVSFEYDMVADTENPNLKYFTLKPVGFGAGTAVNFNVTFFIRVKEFGVISAHYAKVSYSIQDNTSVHDYQFEVDPGDFLFVDRNPTTSEGVFSILGYVGGRAVGNKLSYNASLPVASWRLVTGPTPYTVSPAGYAAFNLSNTDNKLVFTPTSINFDTGGILKTRITIVAYIEYKDARGDIHLTTKTLNYLLKELSESPVTTSPAFIFRRSPTKPNTPEGNNPSGWASAAYGTIDDGYLWLSTGNKTSAGNLVGVWSEPVALDYNLSQTSIEAIIEGVFSSLLTEIVDDIAVLKSTVNTDHQNQLTSLASRVDNLE
jgi:hypothetical protein